jgi:RNA 2',3'-cyclic 3'-phosphodiesterase
MRATAIVSTVAPPLIARAYAPGRAQVRAKGGDGVAQRSEGALRLFFGVPLGPEARRALVAAGRRLTATGWRPSAEAALHVTLRFLGDTAPALLPALTAATAAVARAEPPFEVHLVTVTGLPDARHARVAAALVDQGAEPLRRLSEALGQALEPLGFRPERRPLLAHITLARSGPTPRTLTPLALDVAFRAERVVLWESFLGPPHARYEVRAEAALAPSP